MASFETGAWYPLTVAWVHEPLLDQPFDMLFGNTVCSSDWSSIDVQKHNLVIIVEPAMFVR
jgi:hypothetical protein